MKTKKGFTLIELLVVIAIIGVLSTIVLAMLNEAREKARISKAKSEVRSIKTGIELLYDDTGKYLNGCSDASYSDITATIEPSGEYVGLIARPLVGMVDPGNPNCNWTQAEVDAWKGPYVQTNIDFVDPWGNPYELDYDYWGLTGEPGCPTLYDGAALISRGPDGENYTCDDIPEYFRYE